MRFDATRLTQLGRVSGLDLSPDGSWLAVQVARLDRDQKKYVSDLWRVPTGGGAAVQLTRGEHSDTSPRFRADGALGFLSDRPFPGQSEGRRQVWLLPAAGGEPLPLTDEPLGVSDYRFGAGRLVLLADVLPGVPHDQQRARATELDERGPSGLHYRSMPVRFWDHWLGRAAPHAIACRDDGGGRRDLTPDADREYRPCDLDFGWDLSRDGKRLCLQARRDGDDRAPEIALHLFDVDSGQRTELGRETGAIYGSPCFSPDGSQLAATRHRREPKRCGRTSIQLFNLAGGAPRTVAEDWDTVPEIQDWTADGRALLCTSDHLGRKPVYSVDLASGEVTRITSTAAGGSHGSLRVGDGRAFGVRSTCLQPPEPFAVDLAPEAEPKLLARLSRFEDGASIATVESFEVAGDGGEPVQSFLLRPVSGPDRPPVLMWIHGGPIGQNADGWHWRWNPLIPVAAGYAVVLPNPRGSTGRGQAFIEGIWNNEWGSACYRDLMAVADAIEERADVDGKRMGAMGGSFGGYMANWIGGQTDRFRCLITHASIYHFTAFHGATDEPAWFALELGCNPYSDCAAFERHSPHRYIDRWKTPTLILHGEKDYRVPVSEALLLFEALKLHGVDAELVIFPDENHWILRPRNTRQWYEACEAFLARHMG
jgi:dipeptidyl aminopeptidase/acylaminoacyl peptidase